MNPENRCSDCSPQMIRLCEKLYLKTVREFEEERKEKGAQ
jgi:hypothetical protein